MQSNECAKLMEGGRDDDIQSNEYTKLCAKLMEGGRDDDGQV